MSDMGKILIVDDEEDNNWQNIDDAFRFESTLYFYHS